MIFVRDVEQGTEEWLALRVGCITASRLKDVLAKGRGSAPSKTGQAYAFEIASEILTGRTAEEGFSSFYMDRGKQLEDEARKSYSFITGRSVEQAAFAYLNETRRVGCSPDGLVGNDGLIEIKCPKLSTHSDYWLNAEGCPSEYIAQVQGQMWVCDRQWCDFVSYHPNSPEMTHIVRVERDPEYIEELAEKVAQFCTRVDSIVRQMQKRLAA